MSSSDKTAMTSFDEVKDGEFKRSNTTLRNWVTTDGSSDFPAEAGRYHLYVALACPWACRCLAYIHMKGLQDVISVDVVAPVWQKTKPDDDTDDHRGWVFDDSVPRATKDTLFGCDTLRGVYEIVAADVARFTTPLLVDKQRKVGVNNESAELTKMLNSAFDAFATNPGLDLLPAHLLPTIEAHSDYIYNRFNNGVYRAGFAQSQEAYDAAVAEVFEVLDWAEELLETQRYLAGDTYTDVDVRFVMTAWRFDSVYATHFKCNRRLIREHPNLKGYCQDMFQTPPGIADTVHMESIKQHYYRSHPKVNPFGVVPAHSDTWFSEPHTRAERFRADTAAAAAGAGAGTASL